jgi:hypothetical protein
LELGVKLCSSKQIENYESSLLLLYLLVTQSAVSLV